MPAAAQISEKSLRIQRLSSFCFVLCSVTKSSKLRGPWPEHRRIADRRVEVDDHRHFYQHARRHHSLARERRSKPRVFAAEVTVAAQACGRRIDCADAWIAATALIADAPLITHNRSDYLGVPGLTLISHG